MARDNLKNLNDFEAYTIYGQTGSTAADELVTILNNTSNSWYYVTNLTVSGNTPDPVPATQDSFDVWVEDASNIFKWRLAMFQKVYKGDYRTGTYNTPTHHATSLSVITEDHPILLSAGTGNLGDTLYLYKNNTSGASGHSYHWVCTYYVIDTA